MEQEGSHLLGLVFQYLPVKSLFRFRCLSRWHMSLIDRPEFSEIYRLISAADESRSRRLFLQFKKPFHNSAINGFYPFSNQDFSGQPVLGESSIVATSCLGVLCVASLPSNVVLWNPSTRTHRHIYPPIYQHPNDEIKLRRVSFGLGYDNDKNIKLVRLVFSYSHKTNAYTGEASVYTVRTDTWQTIDCQMTWQSSIPRPSRYKCLRPPRFKFGDNGVYVKHIIKWVVKIIGDDMDIGAKRFRIISLNLNDYKFDTQSLPEFMLEGRNPDTLLTMKLWPFDSTVCLCLQFGEIVGLEEVVIWIQEVEDDNWSKLLTIDREYFIKLKPLFYSKNKKQVLLQMESTLMWFDLRSGDYWNSYIFEDKYFVNDATAYIDTFDLIDGFRTCFLSNCAI